MDFNSVIGVVIALIAVFGGQVLEGGHPGSLLQLTAFTVVLGGTLGAVLLQSPVRQFVLGMKMSRWVFVPPLLDATALVEHIAAWSTTARKEGLLALDPHIAGIDDPFVKKGLQLVVDGTEPRELKRVLEVEIETFDDLHRQGARVWEAAGGYAPTIGILGAVMGLIQVMENLADPAHLGAGIAVAFVATIYGVGLANLAFLPIANKLKSLIARQVLMREMLVDGLVGIANGENPRLISGRLKGYVV
ncbi:chemotaxis protein MotA [Nitrosospira sp. Nsp5]|jgi:chemotaxis protein MotA|uniref:Chemotaxis protein MotA n=1 Tax=Nitrosospira multiformis TaxID=1231 RepID=A0ABY0TE75_9PROT|nr:MULTISPECIES: flagellar motor protein [Nitrosospira]PTR09003.1 chemotaxis protein MotA [Nitrosospira sp. Nsp5]SDQ68786.1 chemotaxis protein MotA [Nitrosospira multiformis]